MTAAWQNASLMACRNLWPDVADNDGRLRIIKMMNEIGAVSSKYDSVTYNNFIVVQGPDVDLHPAS
jgi:hypothetical protein